MGINNVNKSHPVEFQGFVWQNPTSAKKKLDRFKKSGFSSLHLVWDWDGTVVAERGSTWHALCNALPKELQEEHRALYRIYKPMEDQGKLTAELEREWCEQVLTLHIKNKTSIEMLRRAATIIEVRPGAEEVFASCQKLGIPSVILSAGVKDIIEIVARRHGISLANVLATKLMWADGKISGWNEDSLIVAKTKKEKGHPQLSILRKQRPHALLFGNRPHDADMFDGDGIRIRVDGYTAVGTNDWRTYLEKSWLAGYDGVTVKDNLLGVADLNRWLTS